MSPDQAASALLLLLVVRRFPDGIRHGLHVDVHTLSADAAVYGPDDANCCPSRDARLQLRLKGDSLQMVSVRIVAQPPGDASTTRR